MRVCQLPRIVRSFTAAQIGQPMCTENRHRSNQSTKRVRPKRIPATSNEARLRADSPIRNHVYTRYFPSGRPRQASSRARVANLAKCAPGR